MTWLTPAESFVRGLKIYLEGVRWLRAHPAYLALLTIPVIVGVFFLAGGLALFSAYDEAILARILFQKPTGLMLALYYFCQVLLYLAVILITFLASLLLMNVVAAPLYEIVSMAVERDITGQAPPSLGLRDSLRVMLVELKKVALILLVTIVLLFIPGFNVLSTLVAAFLVGWDFFDYPAARRGFSLRQRVGLVRDEAWAVLGFGLWLVIPVLQIVMLPLAVAGGTMLNLDAMKRRQLLTTYIPREDA